MCLIWKALSPTVEEHRMCVVHTLKERPSLWGELISPSCSFRCLLRSEPLNTRPHEQNFTFSFEFLVICKCLKRNWVVILNDILKIARPKCKSYENRFQKFTCKFAERLLRFEIKIYKSRLVLLIAAMWNQIVTSERVHNRLMPRISSTLHDLNIRHESWNRKSRPFRPQSSRKARYHYPGTWQCSLI